MKHFYKDKVRELGLFSLEMKRFQGASGLPVP